MDAAGVVALFLTLWFATRIVGYRGIAGRIGLAGAVAALMMWTEPFQWNFSLGQVNVLVMLPIVIDLSLSDRSRFKGIGIGLATASKLLPGLFVVYLLLTRRIRAAVTACVTFAVLTAIGWIIQPGGSNDYWLSGRAFDSHRVLMMLGPRYMGNQSLQGTVARVLGTDAQNSIPWLLSVVVAAVAGLALAVWAQRRGEEAVGMVIVGFTGLLISPVSWSHYWLWIAPMMIVLIDVARRASGRTQTLAAGVAALAILPFLTWPTLTAPAPNGALLPNGIIWVSAFHSKLVARLGADPYIPTVLGLFVLAAIWLRIRSRDAGTAVAK
jgi:alpha-1,2-mannosyltransferase